MTWQIHQQRLSLWFETSFNNAVTPRIQLRFDRFDYDPTTTHRARLFPFDASKKMNTSVFRRSRIVVESQLWYRLYRRTVSSSARLRPLGPWSCRDHDPDLWPLTPKPNQFIVAPRCTTNKRLMKTYQTYQISEKRHHGRTQYIKT